MSEGKNTVTQQDIEAILSRATIDARKAGAKTCVVHVTLANGFELTETAACVDPANYNADMGKAIAMKRIADRLWQLEGWRLQCRLSGEP